MKNQGTLAKYLLLLAGSLFVGLGVLGILLPILPTTPFLLLAAACYIRSSERFYDWLITNRLFGSYIKNYREGRGMALRIKLYVIALLWLTIGYSMTVVPLWPVRGLLLLIAVGVTAHLIAIKTLHEPDETP